MPDGVFNVVTSARQGGAVVGRVLTESMLVDAVSFTGSTATGREIIRASADNNKRVGLELGGKSANIVFEDAPFDEAVRSAAVAFTFNSGQQCSSGSRLLVQRSIHRRFVDALIEQVKRLPIGDPKEESTAIGPLITPEHRDRVLSFMALASQQGHIVLGGDVPQGEGFARGNFVSPTIVDELSSSARIAQEEIFGPVLAVIPFLDETDAIEQGE